MAMITRADAEALIPVEASREIIQNVPQRSKLLQLMRRLPNMTASQKTIPVMSQLPTASFVNGAPEDTTGSKAYKSTTNAKWGNLTITAEELAVIIPISENVLADADYDIWGELRPQIEEAFGVAIDAAIAFGTNKPATWADAIVPTAITKGNTVTMGTGTDLASEIVGPNGLMAQVENDGYRVNAFFADGTMEAYLRDLRDKENRFLYTRSLEEYTPDRLVGRPVWYDNQGIFNAEQALMIAGDWSNAVYAIRQDLTYKVLTEAVIQDTSGNIIYNLAQQDMVALRCVMRLGVQIAIPVTRRNENNANRYPFAVLQPAAARANVGGGEVTDSNHQSLENLTNAQLKALLDKKGISYNSNATKAELIALLNG